MNINALTIERHFVPLKPFVQRTMEIEGATINITFQKLSCFSPPRTHQMCFSFGEVMIAR